MVIEVRGPRDVNGNRRELELPEDCAYAVLVSAEEFRRLAVVLSVPLNAEDADIVESGG